MKDFPDSVWDYPTIDWTRPMLERFKKVVKSHDEAKVDTLMFDGNEFVVSYALYLIQFLETQLPP